MRKKNKPERERERDDDDPQSHKWETKENGSVFNFTPKYQKLQLLHANDYRVHLWVDLKLTITSALVYSSTSISALAYRMVPADCVITLFIVVSACAKYWKSWKSKIYRHELPVLLLETILFQWFVNGKCLQMNSVKSEVLQTVVILIFSVVQFLSEVLV